MNKQAITKAFSAVAETYSNAAYIEAEIGNRLLDKLNALNITPSCILDLGCGPASFYTKLQALYPSATIIGLDIAFNMLNFAKTNSALFCCADAEFLPFPAQIFDLIFSNCCLPSIQDLPKLFKELQRCLQPNGALLFSTFGPRTLPELGLENNWPDLHLIGDLLMQLKFKNPVLDMEDLKFKYHKLLDLCSDLQQSGSFNIDTALITNLDLACEASFEAIYGMCFKNNAAQQFTDEIGNIYIPITKITHL